MTDRTLKVVLLGNLGVGKTCLRSQFVHHMFTNAYKATIGGDYLTSTVKIRNHTHDIGIESPNDDQVVNLQIWDTAGQERFNSISQAFYRGTDVVVLVYDVTNYESVIALNGWFTRFMEHCHVDRPGVVIVANKIDKPEIINREDVYKILSANPDGGPCIQDYINSNNHDDGTNEFDYQNIIEVSLKKLELVEKVFQRVAEIGVVGASNNTSSNPRLVGFDIDVASQPQTSRCC